MAGFLGMRGTGDWATDERPKNWRQGMIVRRKFFGEASRLFASIGLGNIAFRQVGEGVMPSILTQEQATQRVLMRKAFETDMILRKTFYDLDTPVEQWKAIMSRAIEKVQITDDAWDIDLWDYNEDE